MQARHGLFLNSKGRAGYRCFRPVFQDMVVPHIRRSVQASAIESEAWAVVEQALIDPAQIANAIEREKRRMGAQQSNLDRERQEYARQVAQCEKELSRWYAAYA